MTLQRIAFVWDNFGPLHADRCNAVARHLRGSAEVLGIELFAGSDLYDWIQPENLDFQKQTLFEIGRWGDHANWKIASAIVRCVQQFNCEAVFLSHYNEPAILLAALRLRRKGIEIVTMGCSKYDDARRSGLRERAKRLFLKPYSGAIGSEDRSLAYFRFLGLPEARIFGGYNTVDQDRIRRQADYPEADRKRFAERPFLAVARLIWEKNFPGMLRAYAAYSKSTQDPRRLQIAGSGPLEAELKALATNLGIESHIDWLGFVQTEQVAPLMRDALCILLPSVSETFGNVVPEALALDLPVLASTQCGATDRLTKNGVSGFTFQADDEDRLAELMIRVSGDEDLWTDLRNGARELAPLGHSDAFANSVARLIGG
ncbi:hypothetical protein GCM10023115_06310 [Pontixanthobacter gangjinensis]|uniref:Glycosyltransferase n=1 Tax=Pontixanthobacter gangjinensis TaxID=1028742 RepID=A0A6I4SL65_9SPHN|nr:glycosyltransferase [Pontixanthobacter gangjinensis]MXO55880.1 glycosyltransferase [Pontixanthobacter gangjinensis]